MSPVPLWPGDGEPFPFPNRQSLFYDPHTGEYVVHYVAGEASVEPVLVRFGTHSLVDPEVGFDLVPTASGYQYMYDVRNGLYAKQSIEKIRMLASADGTPRSSNPGWTTRTEAAKVPDAAAHIADSVNLEWRSSIPTQSIAPGTKMEGLVIDSTSLPGFTAMICSGHTQSKEYSADAVSYLPIDLRDQLARVFTTTWDAKTRIVIGPKFVKGTSQTEIAQNYLFGIKALIRTGKLDRDSTFTNGVVKLLSAQVDSGGLFFLDSNAFGSSENAAPGLETVIAHALQYAFK